MNLFNAFAKRSLPQTEGAITLEGIRAPVEIIRDRWGVPHIYAASIDDVLFAQGFVHAQDRLWQMDVNRRAGTGRLSEIAGATTLQVDRFTRTIGIARAAQAEIDASDVDALARLDAYVAGVNAAIARGQTSLEHRLLRVKLEPWTRLDSAAWGLMLAWALSWNWESELARLGLWRQVGVDAAELESGYPESQPSIVAQTDGLEHVATHLLDAYRKLSNWIQTAGEGVGSNNWVVPSTRTSTGRPMLANDPHMALGLPSIWYENHLVVNSRPERSAVQSKDASLNVTGFTTPGLPGVLLGHNERVAWAATATMADTQDLFIERFDLNDPSRYQTPQGWQMAQVLRESICMRFRRKPVEHTVRVTRHGPVISDIMTGSAHPERSTTESKDALHVALKWSAHQPGRFLSTLIELDRAYDWASFKKALRGWHAPSINMLYADVDGHTAFHVVGRIPIRKQGHGLLPVAGWTDDYEWVGEIPFDELPHLIDSDEPIVTANNRIVGPEYPYFISHEWLNGNRAARIRQRIDACEKVSIEDSLSIHTDVKSLDASELVEHLLKLDARDEREAEALKYLRDWDHALAIDSVAASIYEMTQIEVLRLMFGEHLSAAFGAYIGDGQTALFTNPNFSNIALRQMRLALQEDPNRENILRDALRAALDRLTRHFGADMKTWRWGEVHRVEPMHHLGRVAPLRRVFNRGSHPFGGDGDTPQQANFRPRWPIEAVTIAPSHRVVYDVGAWDNSRAVLPGGQSGHPASAHYFDQFALWLKGEARPMLWSREAVEREGKARLKLTPAFEA